MNEDNPWLSWEYVVDNWPELLAAAGRSGQRSLFEEES